MSIEQKREKIEAMFVEGKMSAADYTLMMRVLDKLEYRQRYNTKPEVKAKRKVYNNTRREMEKMGKAMMEDLLEAEESEVAE